MKQGCRFSSFVLACLLSACGGGGSSGGPSIGSPSGPGSSENSISLDSNALVLVQEAPAANAGVPSASANVMVTYRGAGVVVGTLPGQSPPAWLTVTAPASPASPLKIKIEGRSVQPGKYQTTLRFITGNADQTGQAIKDLPVSLIVLPAVPNEVVVTGAAQGTATRHGVGIETNNAAFTLSSDAAWLTLEKATVQGFSPITVIADPTTLGAGIHTAKVTMKETSTDVTKVVNISFRVAAPQLVVRRRAVALSQVGTRARLQAEIAVGDNGKPGLQWSAQADQPWLKLGQQTGLSGASLAVTADAAGLSNGMHYANVTFKQLNQPAAAPTAVRVGVYVNRAVSYAALASVTAGSPDLFGVIADPLRPYFYHLERAGQLCIYNMYTGALESRIALPIASATAMTVSSDGSRLYVLDRSKPTIHSINLDTRVLETQIVIGSGSTLPDGMRIAYAELSGLPVIVTSAVQVIDARTGAILATRPRARNSLNALVVQRDGTAMFAQTGTLGNHELARYSLSNIQGAVSIGEGLTIPEPGDGAGLALDMNDTYLYSASSAGGTDAYRYTTRLTTAGKLPAPKGDVSGIAVTSSGSVLISTWWKSSLEVYSAALLPLSSHKHGERADDLTISGEGDRVAMYVQQNLTRKIYFIEVP